MRKTSFLPLLIPLILIPKLVTAQTCGETLGDKSSPAELISCVKEQARALRELSDNVVVAGAPITQSISAICNQSQTIKLAKSNSVVGCWLTDISIYRHGANLGELRCQIEQRGGEYVLNAIGDSRFCSTAGAISVMCSATCR